MKLSNIQQWFATAPIAMEGLLASELKKIGASEVKESKAGVSFQGSLKTAYKVVMWSRLASRVLIKLKSFPVNSRNELYSEIYSCNWSEHLNLDTTFVVRANAKGSVLNHSDFVARVIKDAVADYFRDKTGSRPSVDKHDPDLGINCRIVNNNAELSLEINGAVLHKRGYRTQQGMAPLRENVAAAMLLRAGWPDNYDENLYFVDPMCGSGTIAIEAAMMAADIAPGIIPGAGGLNGWIQHQDDLWDELDKEAQERRSEGLKREIRIFGFDTDERILEFARRNAARAQVEHMIEFNQADIDSVCPPDDTSDGLIAVNPPYGQRMLADDLAVYHKLGKNWASNFHGWNAIVITDDSVKARGIGLRARKLNKIYNGGLECVLAQFKLGPENQYREYHDGAGSRHGLKPQMRRHSQESEAFGNRLKKNLKRLRSWLKKQNISCYRLYDADMPNFSLAVDIYEHKWAVVQEYAPPKSIDPVKANDRLHDALRIIPEITGITRDNVFLKQRKRQTRGDKYQKTGSSGHFEEINE